MTFHLLGLLACSGGSTTPADSGTVTVTDTEPPQGLLVRSGSATVSDSYTGSEQLRFTGDEGAGELLCELVFELTSTTVRDDCEDCLWAFDLVLSGAQVLVDEAGACLALHGVDASTVSTWDGTTRSYGYNDDYVGHAKVLMFDDGEAWIPVTMVTWDADAGSLSYDWIDGYHAY